MDKLKIGVVGTGHLGKLHTKMFQQIQNCELTGIYDTNPENLANVAREFNTRAFGSFDEMIQAVDAVSIAVTTSAHYQVAKECLLKNKHIFIEKPITSSIPQGEEIVKFSHLYVLL